MKILASWSFFCNLIGIFGVKGSCWSSQRKPGLCYIFIRIHCWENCVNWVSPRRTLRSFWMWMRFTSPCLLIRLKQWRIQKPFLLCFLQLVSKTRYCDYILIYHNPPDLSLSWDQKIFYSFCLRGLVRVSTVQSITQG